LLLRYATIGCFYKVKPFIKKTTVKNACGVFPGGLLPLGCMVFINALLAFNWLLIAVVLFL
jgi:hypothetical protein